VTNVGTDRNQLSNVAAQARTGMGVETLDAVADRGYYEGEEIKACEESGITVTLPKPQTSGAKAAGRFGKQDFVYIAADDVYRCPAGERLTYRYTNREDGKTLRRYWTSTCKTCALKAQCTTGSERRIARWEHEAVLEKVQDRLDHNPAAMGIAVVNVLFDELVTSVCDLAARQLAVCRPAVFLRLNPTAGQDAAMQRRPLWASRQGSDARAAA
jgi:hypothetical protein